MTPQSGRCRPRSRRLFAGLPALLIMAAACAGSGTQSTAASPTLDRPDATTSPVSPARVQLDWIVAVLDSGGQLTVADVEERFSPAFLAEFPPGQLVALFPQVLAVAEPPFAVERFDSSGGGDSAEAVLLGSDGRRLSVGIAVAAVAPNLIEGLGIAPTELEFTLPINVDALDDRMSRLGPQSSLGVYDVTSGDCVAVHEIRTDSTIVLGSVFKLWVLTALAHEIDAGRASWGETVAITDELRSSADGEIHELETGTDVTLQRLAEAMISISDNTATDMLIDRLGRETVEAALERAGVADPSANIPMLSTGNLFSLKYLSDPPNAADYRVLDEAGQRSLLAELDASVAPWISPGMTSEEIAASTNVDGVPIDEPRDLDIEWFATADDLCRTLAHLSGLAETPGLEPVAAILEINPGGGLPFDRDRWPTVRFKGGQEPGVVAGAWWFEDADGDRYVVAGGVSNPDAAVDVVDAVLILASAIELID